MLKKISKILLIFLVMLILLSSLLTIVNLIPRNLIKENVEESLQTFINEGYYPKVRIAHRYLLDNYTDALMVNAAYSIDDNEPLESAMLMRINYIPGEELKLQEIGNNDAHIEYLMQNINGTSETYFEYSRYWHGYMIYLRPLLLFLNYSQIRIVLITVIIILSITLIYLAYKKVNKDFAIATSIMLIISSFWVIGLSLQYSSVFLITLISCIYILLKNRKQNIDIVFFIIGILTAFFDLLTTPILTLGIPLIFYISQNKNCNFKKFLKIIIFWGIGYGAIWMSKWILADIICNTATIESAVKAILHRTNGDNINTINVVNKNIYYMKEALVMIVPIASTSFILSKNSFKELKKVNTQQYLILSIIPFIWYIFTKNHSYIHARFTYRNLLITALALSIVAIKNIKLFLKQ